MTEIGNEYGTALFALACECREEDSILDALREAESCFAQNEDYFELLCARGIPLEERLSLCERAFSALPEHASSFILLLCEKGHLRSFSECVEAYRTLYNERRRVCNAKITSAVALTQSEKTALIAKLEGLSGRSVCPEYTVDSAILGGVIVEMDGRVIDGSLRSRLNEVKEVISR